LGFEGEAAGDALEGDDGHAPEVGAGVDGLALGLLGAHVEGGAEEGAALGEEDGDVEVGALERFGDAEVEDFDEEGGVVFGEEEVGGFEVAVDDA